MVDAGKALQIKRKSNKKSKGNVSQTITSANNEEITEEPSGDIATLLAQVEQGNCIFQTFSQHF